MQQTQQTKKRKNSKKTKNTIKENGELSINDLKESEVVELHKKSLENTKEINKKFLKGDVKCLVSGYSEGRVSHTNRSKYTAYHIAYAFHTKDNKVPPEVLKIKHGQNDKSISHTCGTKHCLIFEHMKIETKGVNDERSNCHHALEFFYKKLGEEIYLDFLGKGAYNCHHEPPCCNPANN
jgi:hypothetical protein